VVQGSEVQSLLLRYIINRVSKLICIKTYITRPEAQIAQKFLRSHGIRSFITADDLGGANPLLTLLGPGTVRLLISREQADRATKILTERLA
jgi:Putative prokaryotic signal transducing protein